jgi:hypothetical protein
MGGALLALEDGYHPVTGGVGKVGTEHTPWFLGSNVSECIADHPLF